jgi:hypothetical protein
MVHLPPFGNDTGNDRLTCGTPILLGWRLQSSKKYAKLKAHLGIPLSLCDERIEFLENVNNYQDRFGERQFST